MGTRQMLYIALVPDSSAADPAVASPHAEDERTRAASAYFAAMVSSDYATLEGIMTPDAVTHWPQSGELITGAMTCIRVYENYPGGPPAYSLRRVVGEGSTRTAELEADYGTERWYVTSILEFEGNRIARITDYFGPTLPAPEWRRELVDAGDDVAAR
jgi:hypothetical protein